MRGRSSILAALLGIGAASCAPSAAPPVGARSDAGARYVGRDACLGCHAGIGGTAAETGMGRAFYPLTRETAVEDFSKKNRFDLPADGLAYEMTASPAGGYVMRQIVLDADGATLAMAEEPMRYVVGSGNHSRSYLTGGNGYLYQMPICWYPDKPGWDLCPGYELRNRYFNREADLSCVFCHNGRMLPFEGTSNRFDDRATPHGIDCERCHGPGEDHVELWTKHPPATPPEIDPTIVNPAKLERGRRIHVCLQCHLGDADASERVQRPDRDLLDFRPGAALTDFVDTMTYDPPVADRFAIGGQGDRLLLSRCYRESGGGLDCLTCHDPHVSVYSPARPKNAVRRACLTCHATKPCALPISARAARGDDCAACHMRRSEPVDQRFTAFTDHWIRRRISPPGGPAPARPALDMVPVFPEAHRAYPGAEPALNLGRAYLVKRTGAVEGGRIPWSRPEALLREASASADPPADAWFLLGKAAVARGDLAEAIGDLREALRLDPRHHHARANLASALIGTSRAAEAEPLLRESIREMPGDPSGPSDLSRVLVMTGRAAEGRALLESAIAEHPSNPTLLGNLGLLDAKEGRHAEAVERLRAAGALDPSIAEIWRALAASLLELGRPREAIPPARRAARLRPGDASIALLLRRAGEGGRSRR